MVVAAHIAKRKHPYWKAQYRRLELEKRIGKQEAQVTIARKSLIAVWHILTDEVADRFASDEQVACAFFALAYKVGVRNLPEGQSAKEFTRGQLDRLGLGQDLEVIPWGSKRHKLPPSTLT